MTKIILVLAAIPTVYLGVTFLVFLAFHLTGNANALQIH